MSMRPATAPRGQALVLRKWIVMASPTRVNTDLPKRGPNDSAVSQRRIYVRPASGHRDFCHAFVCHLSRSGRRVRIVAWE